MANGGNLIDKTIDRTFLCSYILVEWKINQIYTKRRRTLAGKSHRWTRNRYSTPYNHSLLSSCSFTPVYQRLHSQQRPHDKLSYENFSSSPQIIRNKYFFSSQINVWQIFFFIYTRLYRFHRNYFRMRHTCGRQMRRFCAYQKHSRLGKTIQNLSRRFVFVYGMDLTMEILLVVLSILGLNFSGWRTMRNMVS